uniref:Uncharacterized protein n=1 Tax=Timema shepardi TaxID=629360 RepID=A0A7R9G6X0_TIMSH|nr:unnamed protein product [Timema shepardi]
MLIQEPKPSPTKLTLTPRGYMTTSSVTITA